MNLHKFYAVVFTLCCLQMMGIRAYPTLNIRRLFDSAAERYKKGDLLVPQVSDDDVLELEHLKRSHEDELPDDVSRHQHHPQKVHETQAAQDDGDLPQALPPAADPINHSDILPQLERQLEAEPPAKQPIETSTAHEEEAVDHGAHRPPILPHNDGGKAAASQPQAESAPGADGGAGVPTMAKPFYGAARLAFGQNPEVLPTPSTTTTSTTTTTTTTSTASSGSDAHEVSKDDTDDAKAALPAVPLPELKPLHPIHPSNPDLEHPTVQDAGKGSPNKETVGDVLAADLEGTKTAARRSVAHLMTPQTAENLLRHKDGQYSSFDMAQYVFWTGDEAGVARAVEEFIEQGLMTRENALKFLRDIRLGIEYLQRSYASRVFPEEMRENHIKKSYPPPTTAAPTTTTTTTTEKPFPRVNLDLDGEGRRSNVHFQKALDSASIWNKLQELNEGRQELSDYDEAAGRAKIAEFLYTEYTLEEILYNLAKVMFTQSLAHGSDEAQRELQKLTDFLEREGNRGVIPLDLQKKVLHVLLTALSDTLSERPELLPAARLNLGSSFNSLPMRTYGTLQ